MSNSSQRPDADPYQPNPWPEITGRPNPGALDTVDASIRKVIVAQKRETNRKSFPDLSPD